MIRVVRGGAVALAFGLMSLQLAHAQAPAPGAPSPAQVALAKEIVTLKGGNIMFDPLVPGVIENVKNMLLPTNLNLEKQLNEVSAQLKKQYESKKDDLNNEVARAYAKRFTEQELKDLLAFYRSPLGKKVVVQEPNALDEANRYAQDFANSFTDQIMTQMRIEMKKRGYNL
jgi:hypothetical protein